MKLPLVRTKIQTRYSDTDALGHISSGSYVTFMEVGRLEFYNQITEQTGLDLTTVVVNINLDYFKECRYGDEIEVISWCSKVGSKSLVISARILANKELVAEGSSTNVAFDTDSRSSIALPENFEPSADQDPR